MRTIRTATQTIPTTYRTAHPALRSVPSDASATSRAVSRRAAPAAASPSPTSFAAPRGASATEVDAVAHLIETFAPDVTVRAVSRKRDVYVVRAVAAGRTRLYRIPVDMVPSAGRLAATPEFDHAA